MSTRYLRQNRVAEKKVAAFNCAFRVGDEVIYTAYQGAAPVRDRIFADAELLGGHSPVVWLAGQLSCVHVDQVKAVAAEASNA